MTERNCVLITGAAGFVAAHTAVAFREAGWEVALLDLREPQGIYRRVIPTDMPLYLGNVLDSARLDEVLDEVQPSGVVHAAAIVGPGPARQRPADATRINVVGTLNVLEAARARGLRVTYLSTATLYGTRPDLQPLREEEIADPVSLYDATKFMGETLVMAYHKTYGVDAACIRPSFVYGPGAATGEYLLPRAMRGESLEKTCGADHPFDFTYVGDLARGIFLAHTVRPIEHRVFNISGGRLRTFADLANAVRQVVPSASISLGPGLDPGRHLRGPSDITRARNELGYTPQYDLEQGVRAWWKWLVEHGE